MQLIYWQHTRFLGRPFVKLSEIGLGGQAYAATEWDALNRKTTSLFQQGNYTKAAVAAKKALQAAERALGPDHPNVATSLNNLGMLCYAQEQFMKAELLHQRALTIREKVASIIQMWPKV